MGQIFAVFRNTFLESVRQPVFALVLVVSCAIIAFIPAVAAHIYTFPAGSGMDKPAERMVADLGLATTLLSGLILAVLTSSSVIDREVKNKTALTVLSKHLSRTAFIFGKYLGVACAIALAATANTIFVLLTVRLGAVIAVGDPLDYGVIAGMILSILIALGVATFRNYFRGRAWIGSFAISFVVCIFFVFIIFGIFDKNYEFVLMPSHSLTGEAEDQSYEQHANAGITYDWDVARAGVLTLLAILVLSGVSVAASTRLETGGNLLVSGAAFVGGLTSEYLHGESLRPDVPPYLSAVADLWYATVPNLQVFYMSDALTRERPIPYEYMTSAGLYAASYILGMLFLASFLFQKREIA